MKAFFPFKNKSAAMTHLSETRGQTGTPDRQFTERGSEL